MMQDYFELLKSLPDENRRAVHGYNVEELKKISELYDIVIENDFRDFLLKMGRCDGGLVGDDPYRIYCPNLKVRSHILMQVGFFNDLQELGAYEYLNKPFVISCESETQYYFLQTSSASDQVYRFDENEGKVHSTQFHFSEYLLDAYKRYVLDEPKFRRTICLGELIVI